jgi:hypothetical protein
MPSDIGTSRRRQYQVRDLVTQLANLNQTLEQRVAKRTAEAIEQAQKLRLLSTELSLAEEAERRRIAEMLHEDLQQLLVAARMQLAALCITRCAAQREPIAREIAGVLERSFELTRSLSVELAPKWVKETPWNRQCVHVSRSRRRLHRKRESPHHVNDCKTGRSRLWRSRPLIPTTGQTARALSSRSTPAVIRASRKTSCIQ